MTIAEFIAFLQTKPQDLPVAYTCYSEQCLLDVEDIRVAIMCEPRPDGWIQDWRPDTPAQTYLLLPGN